MQVRTVLAWQTVAPSVVQPVPAVTPAGGHWQEPTPSAPWQNWTPTQEVGAEAVRQRAPSVAQLACIEVPTQ